MKHTLYLLILITFLQQPVSACVSLESTSKDTKLLSNLGINLKTIREYKYIGFPPHNISSLSITFKPTSNEEVYSFSRVNCKVNTASKIWSCENQLLYGFDIQKHYVYTDIDVEKQELVKLKQALTSSIQLKERPKKGRSVTKTWRNYSLTGNSDKLTLHEQSCHGNWITYKKKFSGKDYSYQLESTNEFSRI